MTQCSEKLKQILEDIVMPDLEDAIDDIFDDIASTKGASKEQENDLDEMQELRKEFTLVLEDIKNNQLDEEECKELLDEIADMISKE